MKNEKSLGFKIVIIAIAAVTLGLVVVLFVRSFTGASITKKLSNDIKKYESKSEEYSKELIENLESSINKKFTNTENRNAELSSLVSTKAGELQYSINKIDKAISEVSTNVNKTNEDVTSIKDAIGTKEDTTDETLFGKTTLLVDKVTGIEGTLSTIGGDITSANEALARIEENVSIKFITDDVIQQAYDASGHGIHDVKTRITNAVNWLKDNGYAKK